MDETVCPDDGEEEAPRGQWVPGNPHVRVEVQFSNPSMVILGEQGAKVK